MNGERVRYAVSLDTGPRNRHERRREAAIVRHERRSVPMRIKLPGGATTNFDPSGVVFTFGDGTVIPAEKLTVA